MTKGYEAKKGRNQKRARDIDGAFAQGAERLPRWKLEKLYTGFDDPALAQDIDYIKEMAEAFQNAYGNGIARLSGDELAVAIESYEEIEALYARITRYCQLVESVDRRQGPQAAIFSNLALDAASPAAFFERALAALREQDLMTRMASPALAHYAPWIAKIRALQAHESGPLAAHEKFSGANAKGWSQLYADTMAKITVRWSGRDVSLDEAFDIYNTQAQGAVKKDLYDRMEKAMKDASRRVTAAYNVMLKDIIIEADVRGHTRVDAHMLAENGLTPAAADAMRDAVRASFHRLSNKFYAMGGNDGPELEKMTFADAQTFVVRAFRRLSPRLSRWAQKLFDGHIDAAPAPEKEGGAFAMPMDSGALPFILLTFDGSLDSVVSSLAHEVGHGVHQIMAARAQGHLMCAEPTTISETASIFAEMMMYDELLRGEINADTRAAILGAQVEGLLQNGLEQLSYYEFERRAVEARRKGPLSTEQLGDLWADCQRDFYGPSHKMDSVDKMAWMTVPHFFDTPFYVFSYSFAQMLAASLFEKYKEAEAQGEGARKAFTEKYIALLETGMTKNLYETLAPFGLDPDDKSFWESGLLLIEQKLETFLQEKDNAHKPPSPAVKNPKPAP